MRGPGERKNMDFIIRIKSNGGSQGWLLCATFVATANFFTIVVRPVRYTTVSARLDLPNERERIVQHQIEVHAGERNEGLPVQWQLDDLGLN